MIRKIIKALWILLAIAVVAVVIIFVSISKGWIGYMPVSYTHLDVYKRQS